MVKLQGVVRMDLEPIKITVLSLTVTKLDSFVTVQFEEIVESQRGEGGKAEVGLVER